MDKIFNYILSGIAVSWIGMALTTLIRNENEAVIFLYPMGILFALGCILAIADHIINMFTKH